MKSFNTGLLLILIGVVYLLGSLGTIATPHLSLFALWPLIPLIWGLNALGHGFGRLRRFGGMDAAHMVRGLFWTAVGGGFLARNLGFWSWRVDTGEVIAPLFLVFLGLQIVTKTSKGGVREGGNAGNVTGAVGELRLNQPWTLTDNTVSMWVGEILVDVTKALMPHKESHLLITALAGECTILVPRELEIAVNVDMLAGEARVLEQEDSGVFRKVRYKTPGFDTADKRLTIDIRMKAGEVSVRAV